MRKAKITKKSVRNLLREFKDGTPMGWEINNCVATVIDYRVTISVDYVGQGMCGILYNGYYREKLDIKDKFMSYRGLGGELNLEEATSWITEYINNNLDK